MPAAQCTSRRIPLVEIFPPQAVLIGLKERHKAGVIAELVGWLVEMGSLSPQAESSINELILSREALGSTALGNGLATPHCRSSLTESFVGAIGIDGEGILFDAVDKRPVHVVFLIVGPLTHREQYFDVLGRINSITSHKALRMQLCGCHSADAVRRVLTELDSQCDVYANVVRSSRLRAK